MTKYFVLNEHTLGYLICSSPAGRFGILGWSVLRGSPYGPLDGWTIIAPGDRLRFATLDDFEFFRVSPKGHLT